MPDPVAISRAVDRVVDRGAEAGKGKVRPEIAFFGGDFWALPRSLRTAMLDTAEWEVRRGRAQGIRLTLSPRSVLRTPLSEFVARGLTTVEVPVHSMERDVFRRLGSRLSPKLGLEALGRLNHHRIRSVAHLTPGLPNSTHETAVASAAALSVASPTAVRVHPALVLEGTVLAQIYGYGEWQPMTQREAVLACREILDLVRDSGIEVARVGLQPVSDLLRGPEVVAGPWEEDFRGRVEAERMRVLASAALTSAFSLGTRGFTFVVHPREESWLRGLEGSNLRLLKEQFRLDELRVLTSPELSPGEVKAHRGLLAELPPRPGRHRDGFG